MGGNRCSTRKCSATTVGKGEDKHTANLKVSQAGKLTCNNFVCSRKLLDVICKMHECMKQFNNAQKLQDKILKMDTNACAHGIKLMAD